MWGGGIQSKRIFNALFTGSLKSRVKWPQGLCMQGWVGSVWVLLKMASECHAFNLPLSCTLFFSSHSGLQSLPPSETALARGFKTLGLATQTYFWQCRRLKMLASTTLCFIVPICVLAVIILMVAVATSQAYCETQSMLRRQFESTGGKVWRCRSTNYYGDLRSNGSISHLESMVNFLWNVVGQNDSNLL